MAQTQFKSDDTDKWIYGYGSGIDGDLTISGNTTEAPIDASCTGTAGQYTLSATNASFAAGQAIMIHKSRGNTTVTAGSWELNYIVSYVAGTITTFYPLKYSYNDSGADQSQVRVLKQYNNVTINTGVTYTTKAWNQDVGGIIGWIAKGTTTITGTLSVKGTDALNSGTTGPGYGGGSRGAGNGTYGTQGEGTAGATGTRSNVANGSGAGGGTRNSSAGSSPGGGGGNATAGVNGTPNTATYTTAGTGGTLAGAAALTTMVFGGGGGGGAWDGADSRNGGGGGNGGGIVVIISANTVVTGSILGTGGAGGSVSGGSGEIGAGGGGAGGSILIKTKTATLGTSLVTAAAGAGGLGGYAPGNAGAGAAGRIHLDYKTSYTGTTNPAIDALQDLTLDYPAVGGFLYNFI